METIRIITPTITEQEFRRVHEVLHSSSLYPSFSTVPALGQQRKICVASNGCRYLDIGNIRFMVQNQHKQSHYAMMARYGWKITWGIRQQGSWLYCSQDPSGIYREIKIFN